MLQRSLNTTLELPPPSLPTIDEHTGLQLRSLCLWPFRSCSSGSSHMANHLWSSRGIFSLNRSSFYSPSSSSYLSNASRELADTDFFRL